MPAEMQIESFVEPNFGENSYVVWRRESGSCWIIDPGLPPSAAQILRFVQSKQLHPTALILTHGHCDHIAGAPDILAAFPSLPVLISAEAKPALTDPNENLSGDIGLPVTTGIHSTIDLAAGSHLVLDEIAWHVIDTSGHAPGSRSLYCPVARLVIVGDALFQGSIGRTDFHHSNHAELIRNIRERLFILPEETVVHCGHGPETTIGEERRTNPFVGVRGA